MAGHERPDHLLIVEDEQIIALDIRVRLERAGYVVDAMFAAAEPALDYLEGRDTNERPDLILMDVRLEGEMDGINAAERIADSYSLPVILLTAHSDEDTLRRAASARPFGYIVKPFDEPELRSAVTVAIERNRSERLLAEREQLLAGVLAALDVGVLVADRAGIVRFANDAAARLVGPAVSVGGAMDQLLPKDLIARVRPASAPIRWVVREDGAKNEHADHWRDRREIDVRMSLLPDNSGSVWVVDDVTKREEQARTVRRQAQQLQHARQMDAVGRLAAGLTHDFSNLATVIMGYTRLMIDDIEHAEDRGEHVDPAAFRDNALGAHEAARRSARLSRQLLAFGRVKPVVPSTFVVDEVIDQLRHAVSASLPDAVTLRFVPTAAGVTVHMDPGRLEQILLNLVLNARDAMAGGGTIEVRTSVVELQATPEQATHPLGPGTYLVLRVSDSGVGIPLDLVPQIFEPFYTTKEGELGSGFGLATVYAAVAESDGSIHVTSAVGRGSVFSVYLPVTDDLPETALRVSPADDDELRGSGRVLVIEEDSALRALIVEALAARGYDPVPAQSVGDGLLVLEHYRDAAMIVSDLSAPFGSAGEIVRRYRTVVARRIPVLLTGVVLEEVGRETGTLAKPFEVQDLLRALRDLAVDGHPSA